MLNEAEVRSLVSEAVDIARTTTPSNMCDEAIVQRVMKDEFRSSGWRSRWFDSFDPLAEGV